MPLQTLISPPWMPFLPWNMGRKGHYSNCLVITLSLITSSLVQENESVLHLYYLYLWAHVVFWQAVWFCVQMNNDGKGWASGSALQTWGKAGNTKSTEIQHDFPLWTLWTLLGGADMWLWPEMLWASMHTNLAIFFQQALGLSRNFHFSKELKHNLMSCINPVMHDCWFDLNIQ